MYSLFKWIINLILIAFLIIYISLWILSFIDSQYYQMFFTSELVLSIVPFIAIPLILIILGVGGLFGLLLNKHSKSKIGLFLYKVYFFLAPSIIFYYFLLAPLICAFALFSLISVEINGYIFVSALIATYIFQSFGLILWKNNTEFKKFAPLVMGVFILVIVTMFYFLLMILQEFQPHYYGRFPLNDPKGVYLINYDGEYWLTYYVDTNSCTSNPKQQCIPNFEKKGNTSIEYSPVELASFIDKPVLVTGTFTRIHGPRQENKEYCISTECVMGTGPGIWYNSPLRIETIKLVESDK